MNIEKLDVLTIEGKEYTVASIINYENITYYYLAGLNDASIKFILIKDDNFYEVTDNKIIEKLILQVSLEEKK